MSQTMTTPTQDDESTARAKVHEAGEEARNVADEGRQQAVQLVGDARDAVRKRVGARSSELATTLSGFAEDLDSMANATQSDGPLPRTARQLASTTRNVADRLEREGPEGFLEDLRGFARRRPAVFLGVAFGVGIVAGRLLRGNIDEHRDGNGSSPYPARSTSPQAEADLTRSRAVGTDPGLGSEPSALGAEAGGLAAAGPTAAPGTVH